MPPTGTKNVIVSQPFLGRYNPSGVLAAVSQMLVERPSALPLCQPIFHHPPRHPELSPIPSLLLLEE